MPLSFFDVQRRQRRRTVVLVALLFLLYIVVFALPFLAVRWFAAVLFPGEGGGATRFWALSPVGMAAVLAVGILIPQMWIARRYAVSRLLGALGASAPDGEDRYHRRFSNLVEEMAIAAGRGGEVRAVVAPSITLTAFAAEDGRSGAVIGVTEGLLARLNRDQMQSVVAQGMAHIREGNAALTAFCCAIVAPFVDLAEFFEKLDSVAGDPDMERAVDFGLTQWNGTRRLVWGMISGRRRERQRSAASELMGPLAMLARLASTTVSREREYLADAGAAQYTRNPLALAEALHTIAHHHHFMGGLATGYAPLFIVDPMNDALESSESWFANLFSSHPPVRKRVDALVGMGHGDAASFSWGRPSDVETGRLAQPGAPEETGAEWYLRSGDGWSGPFGLGDLLGQSGFGAEAWVMQRDVFTPVLARQDAGLRHALEEQARGGQAETTPGERGPDGPGAGRANPVAGLCPHCVLPLEYREYEGATVRYCGGCAGHWVKEDQVRRIVARREKAFSESFRAKVLGWQGKNRVRRESDLSMGADDPLGGLYCPDCGQALVRRFYSYQYFVVVDRCFSCQGAWFDREELETLQVLQETKPATPPV